MKEKIKEIPISLEDAILPKQPIKKIFITLPIFLVSTLLIIFLDIFANSPYLWSTTIVFCLISIVSALYEPFLIIKKYCVPKNGVFQRYLFQQLKFDTSMAKKCMTSDTFTVCNLNKQCIVEVQFLKSGLRLIKRTETYDIDYSKVKFKVFVIRNHSTCRYPTPRILIIFNAKDYNPEKPNEKVVLEIICDNRTYNYIKHYNQKIYCEEKLKTLSQPFNFGKVKKRLKIVDKKHLKKLILLSLAMFFIVASSITLGILFSYTIFFMSLLSAFVFLAMQPHIENLYIVDLQIFDKYIRLGECNYEKDEFTDLKTVTFTSHDFSKTYLALCCDYTENLTVPKNPKTEEFMKNAFPLLYLDMKYEERPYHEYFFDVHL